MKTDFSRQVSRREFLAGAAGAMALAVLAACGNDESSDPLAGGAATATTLEPAAESSPVSGNLTVTGIPGDELGPDGHFREIQVASDGTRYLIPRDEIQSGGPPKDGIPSIDNPQFVGSNAWDEQELDDEQFVLGVEVDGSHRAYPFQILVWHELVNDTFEGLPILGSYCPLCGSAIAFVRKIDIGDSSEVVEFGVSGKLYNSDLLMYDRKTESYWSQITGTAVVGELTGQRLEFYPSELMTWGDWKRAYPDSEVLTRSTGYDRDYDNPPYDGYDASPSIWFPVTGVDDRLHAKTRVTGVEVDPETFGAYPDDAVVEHGPINDEIGGVPLLVVANPEAGNTVGVFRRDSNGRALTFAASASGLSDAETGSVWNLDGEAVSGELAGTFLEPLITIKGFWFAWFAFHPETELWMPDGSGN